MYILGRGWILNHMNLHQRQRNLKSACGKTRLNLEFKCGASPWEVPIFNNCNLYIYVNPLSTRAAEGLRSLNRVLKVTPSGRYSLAIYNSSSLRENCPDLPPSLNCTLHYAYNKYTALN